MKNLYYVTDAKSGMNLYYPVASNIDEALFKVVKHLNDYYGGLIREPEKMSVYVQRVTYKPNRTWKKHYYEFIVFPRISD